MRARRALLYMPGDDMRKIRKAATLNVDCICMDMEDGVAASRKKKARDTIVQALNTLDFGNSEQLARINAVGSGLETDDLSTVLPAHPHGIVVPKVESAEHIQWVSNKITEVEKENDWPEGEMRVIAIVESARGIVNLEQIASADPRLEALIFGSEDLASDMGATRTEQGWEIFYARSAVVTHAAAFGLQAIDMVFLDLQDIEGLRREAEQGARMAFAGKQVIHPNQVEPVQTAFTPSEEAIAHANRILAAYASHKDSGVGAFVMDGKLVDAPIVRSAERVISLAKVAGSV